MDVSWTTKKAEGWRIDAFELWCWRRHLRVPWSARRCNHSILKEINPEYSLEGLMLKLKLQYFGHLMRRVDSLEKTLMLVKTEDRRRRGQQRMRWLDGIIFSMDMGLVVYRSWWWTGRPGVVRFIGSQRVGHDWVTELNWRRVRTSYMGFPCGSVGNESTCNAGDSKDTCLIPGLGRFPWRKKWQSILALLPRKAHGQRSLPETLTNTWLMPHIPSKQILSFLSRESFLRSSSWNK